MDNDVKLVIYLIYRLRKVMKLSQNKSHILFKMKRSTYYKVENFNLNLTLLQFFNILELFSIRLESFQILLDLLVPFKDKLDCSNSVSDIDDIIGFKTVAEIDTIILNLIKDTEIYKLNRKVR